MRPVRVAVVRAAAAPFAAQPAHERFPHNEVTRQLASPTWDQQASLHALQTTLTELQQFTL